jgi:hypothetical protein
MGWYEILDELDEDGNVAFWKEWVKAEYPAYLGIMNSTEAADMRKFETGATRDSDETKHDPEGFNSPLVELRFCEYMTKHRVQADGGLRASDNWQKGIPRDAYMKSIWRHMLDLWLHHRGYGHKAKEPLEEALCALRFNIDGYLFEILKER